MADDTPKKLDEIAGGADELKKNPFDGWDEWGKKDDPEEELPDPSVGDKKDSLTGLEDTLPPEAREYGTEYKGVGSFGESVFQVSSDLLHQLQGVQRTTSARVEKHMVLGHKPRLEFLGPDLESISFNVIFNIAFGVNPKTELFNLRLALSLGQKHNLILGGLNIGTCLLVELAEIWGYTGPGGRLLSAMASLKFEEYM